MRLFTLLVSLISVFSGCALLDASFRPRSGHAKGQAASIRARFASKKVVAVVYEVVTKTAKRENVFQFERSVAIDKALINLRFPVLDRSMIQNILEAQRLPDTGSYRQEDIEKIAKQSQADILIIGYVYSTSNPSMLNSERRKTSAILRAIDLKNFEVINSVQAAADSPDVWRRLASELLLLDEGE